MTKHDKWEKFSTQCIDDRGYFSPTRTKTLDGIRHLVDRMGDSDVGIIRSAVVAPDTNVIFVPNNITGEGVILLGADLETYKSAEDIMDRIAPVFAKSVLGYTKPTLNTEEQKEVNNKLRSWGFNQAAAVATD